MEIIYEGKVKGKKGVYHKVRAGNVAIHIELSYSGEQTEADYEAYLGTLGYGAEAHGRWHIHGDASIEQIIGDRRHDIEKIVSSLEATMNVVVDVNNINEENKDV